MDTDAKILDNHFHIPTLSQQLDFGGPDCQSRCEDISINVQSEQTMMEHTWTRNGEME